MSDIEAKSLKVIDHAALLDALEDGVVVLDRALSIRYMNASWSAMAASLGMALAIGDPYLSLFDVLKTVATNRSTVEANLKSVLDGALPQVDVTCVAPVGDQALEWLVTIRPYRIDGQTGAVVQHRDLTSWVTMIQQTERRCFEEEFDKTQATLRMWESVFRHAEWGMVTAHPETHLLQVVNPAFARMHGFTVEEMIGTPLGETFAPESRSELPRLAAEVHEKGHLIYESIHIRKDGSTFPCLTDVTAVKDDHGTVLYRTANFQDITERKRQQAEHERLQAEIIRMQAATLAELSTPLIPISDDVLVMPLIGAMDADRAQRILETLLRGISERRARVAIVDITGMSSVDTQIASTVVMAARAVRLLGAQVVLTGIRPDVAQILVSLGADLTGIMTLATLQSGITYAVRQSQSRQTQ